MYLLKSARALTTLVSLSIVLLSCTDSTEQTVAIEPYTGPVSVVEDFHAIFSDSAKVLYKIASSHMEELQNGDRVFPEGIYVETLDGKDNIESILQSDSAYFNKEKKLWILKENVELHNLKSEEQMFSQELYWDMSATDSTNVYVKENTYVEIKNPDQIFTGYGLRTSQDFKNYEILSLQGVFSVDKEEKIKSEETNEK